MEKPKKRREEKIRSERRKSEKKEDAGGRKGRKAAIHFPMICSSRGSKSRLGRAAGAELSGQLRDEKLHAIVVGKSVKIDGVGPLVEVGMLKKRATM